MKNKARPGYSLLISGATLFLINHAYAGTFMGVEGGRVVLNGEASWKAKNSSDQGDMPFELNRDTLNFRMGYSWKRQRIYGIVHISEVLEDSDLAFGTIHYNFLTGFPSKRSNIFLGISGGYLDFSQSNYYWDGSSANINGPIYGPEVGVIYYMSRNLDLELNARYWVGDTSETHTDSNPDGYDSLSWEVGFDYIVEYGISFNYKF